MRDVHIEAADEKAGRKRRLMEGQRQRAAHKFRGAVVARQSRIGILAPVAGLQRRGRLRAVLGILVRFWPTK